jgi:hypothetical protein
VLLMDQALELARKEGRETVLTVFDLRGFTCAHAICCRNAISLSNLYI